jgi:hypothetical protein
VPLLRSTLPRLVHGKQIIRWRKAVQHLPKVRASAVSTESDSIPANIMWPAKGSGFEADSFSPVGPEQRQWMMIQRLARGRRTR